MRAQRLAPVLLLVAAATHGAGAPEPAPEAVIAALPFAPGPEANRVMVDLAPDGARPFVMMLDTGATNSVVTPLQAREMGVRVRKLKNTPYRRATRLGRDLQFWVDARGSDSGSKTGWEFGILGGDFLDDFVVEIDFPGERVRFIDPKRYEVPVAVDAPGEQVLAARLVASRLLVPLDLGGAELFLLLETGVPATAILSGAAVRQAGIDVARLSSFSSVTTVVGRADTSFYEAPLVSFAGVTFEQVPLLVAEKGFYNQGTGNDSAIGVELLRHFVLRIDYAKRRVWLKHAGPRQLTFLGVDFALAKQAGALLEPIEGGIGVVRVTPGGVADQRGLRDGDRVRTSEGAPPPDEVLRRILEGKELQVARKQGALWVDTLLPEASTPE
jgi:hypothetical protein